MKILLLGANGQVGWQLQRALAPLGQLTACDRSMANLEDLGSLKALILSSNPTVIVNAAAYTAVDLAESEPEKARRINAEAVELLSNEARSLNAWLIHYSTDYIFDGSKTTPYIETDEARPLSVYGETKLQGENAIRASKCRHLVFRTSWVYSARGSNFISTMLRLAGEKHELQVVADQFGVPTSAELIADITALCLYIINRNNDLAETVSGTYHLTPDGDTSWHSYAKLVITEAHRYGGAPFKATADDVHPITTADYPVAALRPSNSLLDTQKLIDTFGVYLPPWQQHVKRLIPELVKALK
jgi:dTDP-4-dehydrorhamnose reductase